MPKKIKVLTGVPLETLGDAMSARKLLNLAKDEKDFEIEWIVVRDKPIEDKAIISIPHVKVADYRSWKDVGSRNFSDADMFVIYPHMPIERIKGEIVLDSEFQEFLKKLPQDKILLSCTEYNSKDKKEHQSLSQYYQFVQRLDTGFGELGAYFDLQKNPAELLSQFKETEEALANMLFQSQSEEKYFASHHLYFGYLNISMENNVSILNKVDRNSFVLTCIRDALRDSKESKKDIDIVVPIDVDNLEFVLRQLTDIERSQLGNIVHADRDKETPISTGKAGINLRVINPFPLKHPAMLYLIARSNPLTMCTGDQSFTEALTYNKICIYQIMAWKEFLYEKFLAELEIFCVEKGLGGKEATLYCFYALLNEKIDEGRRRIVKPEAKRASQEKIRNFYFENKGNLQKQQKLFSDYLVSKFNLNEKFIPAIKKVLFSHPLLKASACGDEKSISTLLMEKKMEVGELDQIQDPVGNTPFLLAACKQNISCMELLVRKGASVNLINKDGEHALKWALDQKNAKVLKFLLEKNVSLELRYKQKTILEYAEDQFKYYNNALVNLILIHHAKQYVKNLLKGQIAEEYVKASKGNKDSFALLCFAARANRLGVIKAIISEIDFSTPDAMNTYFLALRYAAKMGHDEVVQVLIGNEKIDFSKMPKLDFSALNEAVNCGFINIVEMLCKKRPDQILVSGASPYVQNSLQLAINNLDVNMMRLLWAHCSLTQKEEFLQAQKNVEYSSNSLIYLTLLQDKLSGVKKDIMPALTFLVDEMKLDVNQNSELNSQLEDCFNRWNGSSYYPVPLQAIKFLVDRGAKVDRNLIEKIDRCLVGERRDNRIQHIEELQKVKEFLLSKLKPIEERVKQQDRKDVYEGFFNMPVRLGRVQEDTRSELNFTSGRDSLLVIKPTQKRLQKLICDAGISLEEFKFNLNYIKKFRSGAVIDAPYENGDTPFMLALKMGAFDKAKELLDTGLVDVFKKNKNQISPLDYAKTIQDKMPKTLRELLEKKEYLYSQFMLYLPRRPNR